MRDYLLIGMVIVCSLIALRRPVFGMLTFACLGFLNPHSMTWGLAKILPLSQFVAIGTLIGYLFWSEPKRFPVERETILLLALWGIFGISTIFAINPEEALNKFIKISKIFIMVFLSTSLINNENRLHWFLRIIALSLGFYGLKGGIFALLRGGESIVWGPEGSFLSDNNALGLALAMNIPLLFYLSRIENYLWVRRVMRAIVLFSYPAIVCTYSRGAWIGLAMVTVLIIFRNKYRFLLMALIVILGIVILPYLPQLFPQRAVDRYGQLMDYKEEGSAQGRLWAWECCRRVGMGNPLNGGGFDFYSYEIYEKYYPEFIDYWSMRSGRVLWWSCHSIWFTIFAEHGFPGFILWICLIGSCFLSLRQIHSFGKTYGKTMWFTYYTEMLQVALVAFIVVGTFLDAAYFDMFYYLVAVIIIIKDRIHWAQFKNDEGVLSP